ncbi:MAG: tRNA pseudouridine(38-40) synthase TruA, partial [Lysobacteraceae bacterium]
MRLALGIEYDGGGFSGWQRLSASGLREPDGSLQTALARIRKAGVSP